MHLGAAFLLLSLPQIILAESPNRVDLQGLENNHGDKTDVAHLRSLFNWENSTFIGPEQSRSTIFRRIGQGATIRRLLLPVLLFLKIKTIVLLLASLFVKTFLAGLLLSKTVIAVVREDRHYPPRIWYPTEDPYEWERF